ncbi:hypothetical protein CIHG_07894 [Coccidioides immitis H538.4]|uniref:Uncharacterized protein n=3 Tax=Coccidioides immitis TaxID=5501 RepID=A0A0J8R6L3_COCIT|nr:hypothetical protein CIRG_10108 [Coccidioides immitis RMSCC 2394]KMU79383.1 hypothetical protein CISG_07787 [Coccidioides immitis RMSCC 3703]KMU90084.1 hypothetical protein CIHG_07894 [Coccidioides immitis H538.4]
MQHVQKSSEYFIVLPSLSRLLTIIERKDVAERRTVQLPVDLLALSSWDLREFCRSTYTLHFSAWSDGYEICKDRKASLMFARTLPIARFNDIAKCGHCIPTNVNVNGMRR